MIKHKITISAIPEQIYSAWLSSDGHSKMTGATAEISDKIGDIFTAWDGYIAGENLELIKNKKIVQSWRTSEFADDDLDSKLTITLKEVNGGTELTLEHSDTPPDQEDAYRSGWQENYFDPMQDFFQ
ncbi:MAG: SRPBCC domain-containing protein [bacterium]|nr:SRPBCC domain-containing protein [bacterium]